MSRMRSWTGSSKSSDRDKIHNVIGAGRPSSPREMTHVFLWGALIDQGAPFRLFPRVHIDNGGGTRIL